MKGEKKRIGQKHERDEKKVRHGNAVFSETPDAKYVYSHVKTSTMHSSTNLVRNVRTASARIILIVSTTL